MTAPPSVLAIETAALSAWPSLQVAYDGHWVWRAARGYTKRANSICCLDPRDDADAEFRIRRLSDLFARNGLPPTFRVTPLTGAGISSVLDQLGWLDADHSLVLGRTIPDQEFPVEVAVEESHPGVHEWPTTLGRLSGYEEATVATLRAMIAVMACPTRGFLATRPSGEPAAAVLAVVANRKAFFFNVVTAAQHRRQGYARAAMAAALNWCRREAAEFCALQVLVDNTAGRSLYEGLGFAELYRYHYSRPQ